MDQHLLFAKSRIRCGPMLTRKESPQHSMLTRVRISGYFSILSSVILDHPAYRAKKCQ
jgi:hypothetical protein